MALNYRGRAKVRKQNTYQICPSPMFTFTKHRLIIKDLVQNYLRTFIQQVNYDENGQLSTSFTDCLNNLKELLLVKQQKIFPRHKLIVHGIIGLTRNNLPNICFATHTFMSIDCGDDSIGASEINSNLFVAVCVGGFALD